MRPQRVLATLFNLNPSCSQETPFKTPEFTLIFSKFSYLTFSEASSDILDLVFLTFVQVLAFPINVSSGADSYLTLKSRRTRNYASNSENKTSRSFFIPLFSSLMHQKSSYFLQFFLSFKILTRI